MFDFLGIGKKKETNTSLNDGRDFTENFLDAVKKNNHTRFVASIRQQDNELAQVYEDYITFNKYYSELLSNLRFMSKAKRDSVIKSLGLDSKFKIKG